MGQSDKSDNALSESHRVMWEQLDAELDPLLDGGAFQQAVTRLSATLKTMGKAEETGELRARILARRAEFLLDLDEGDAALEDVQEAMELGLRDAATYGLAGWASYHLDKTTRAREYFDKALAETPDEVTLLTGRALVLMELDELEYARADLSHALHQEGQAPELLGLRGEVYMGMGDLEAASRDLQAALELSPDDAEYALTLARLHLVQGDIEDALDVIDGAVDEGEEFALEAILLRSHLHLLAGDSAAARSDAIRASNLYPDEAFAFVQLAHVQLTEGNLTLARKAAQRAVLLDPSLSDSYMVRGAAHQMAGEADEAKKDFERASRAPTELPVFLLGPAHQTIEGSSMGGLDSSILEMLGDQKEGHAFDPSAFARAFGQGRDGETKEGESATPGGMGGMGMDPMGMLDKIFDDSGNIRGPLKPFLKMAFKNAPKIMENLPPGMLGGLDKEELEKMDFSELSSDEIEDRMRQFYQMMKSNRDPAGNDDDDDSDDKGS